VSFPTPWKIEPWTVFGGYRIARARLVRLRSGDADQDFHFLSDEVYPTEAECLAAIASLKGHLKV
jgi:hypothetical protein